LQKSPCFKRPLKANRIIVFSRGIPAGLPGELVKNCFELLFCFVETLLAQPGRGVTCTDWRKKDKGLGIRRLVIQPQGI
jgi:hypothetical protein